MGYRAQNEVNYVAPIIELLADSEVDFGNEFTEQIQERRDAARVVSEYLKGNGGTEAYFRTIDKLLQESEYQRLLLYLPLTDLKRAPIWFRKTYLKSWSSLLSVYDARENFFEGDTFEVDARPDGELERVVKCAHLTPWLVEAGYLRYADLKAILKLSQDNEVRLRSFANVWQMMRDRQILPDNKMRELENLTAQVAQRVQLKPLYVSGKRKKWLEERKDPSRDEALLTPEAKLAGPFSPNIVKDLVILQAKLDPDEIVLVGGSRLKGYGTTDSDWDIYRLQELDDSGIVASDPNAAHIYFNMLWLGGKAVDNLQEIAMGCAKKYFVGSRRKAIERLESDLLLYRLLHKGFARFYGGYDSVAKEYPEMDGDCPFYDDNYRRIATELFVKYVFIPTST